MRTAAARTKPRTAQLKSFPAPTGGWVANQNLAQPNVGINGSRPAQGAALLENFFPTATGATMRRGSELYATLGDGSLPTTSLFSYLNGAQEEFFGATENAIYDITTILTAFNYSLADEDDDMLVTDTGDTFGEDSTIGHEVLTGMTGGDWIAVQFATAGGTFLVLVNGEDDMALYDGTNWFSINGENVNSINYDTETGNFTAGLTLTGATSSATASIIKVIDNGLTGTLWIGDVTGGPFQNNEAITDSSTGAALADGTITQLAGKITGVATSDLSYVWSFKNRLFFVQKETMDAWYLPVDQVGGTAVKFPMGGVFSRGGALLFGASWSLDSGNGLRDTCIFVTTEGEVAVYEGSNPSDAADWTRVGVYRIGRPLGPKAFIRAGGDLVIATSIGFVPLSQAIQRDYAALSPSAVSFPIETAWNEAVELRSATFWHSEVWPSKQMVVMALPTINEQPPVMYVANSRTGAWAEFTNWAGTCLEVFKERLFYGSADGKVVEANITGLDQGAPYTASYVPLFDDLRSPASLKIMQLARGVFRSGTELNERVSVQVDFKIDLPSAPDAPIIPIGNEWGNAIWGTSVWGVQSNSVIRQEWRSVSGVGYAMAPSVQITSGSIVPLDAELIRVDATYQVADIVS